MLLLLNIFEDDQHDHSLSVDHVPPKGGHLAWLAALHRWSHAQQRPTHRAGHRSKNVKGSDASRLVDASLLPAVPESDERFHE